MPTIGIAEWCLDCRGPAALERARQLGLHALHIDVGQPGGDDLKQPEVRRRYRLAARATGTQIAAVAANPLNDYGISERSSADFRKRRDILLAAIEAAVELQAPLVVIPSFESAEIRDEEDLERTADFLRDAAECARPAGIRIATENSLGVEGNLKLLSMVDSDPGMQILIDSQNPVLWGHRVSDLLTALWPHLCGQMHVKDGVNGVMGNARLGAGEARFCETAETLRQLGYDGYLILENEYPDSVPAGIAQDIATICFTLGFDKPGVGDASL